MHYKRWAAVLLGILLSLALTACGAGAETETAEAPETTAISSREQEMVPEETAGSESQALTSPEETAGSESQTAADTAENTETEETMIGKKLHLQIDGQEIAVVWEDNDSVRALEKLAKNDPLTVQMSMYGGFEQVGPLGADLPRNDSRTTTKAGDIVLYSGDQIVIFYGSNTWAYTRLGRAADKTDAEMAGLLGSGAVTVTLTVE